MLPTAMRTVLRAKEIACRIIAWWPASSRGSHSLRAVSTRSWTSTLRTIGTELGGKSNMRQNNAAMSASVSSRAAAGPGPSWSSQSRQSAGWQKLELCQRGHPRGHAGLQWATRLKSSRRV